MNETGSQTRVLLSGGTSQVGVFTLPRLLEAGYTITALSRRIPLAAQVNMPEPSGPLQWNNPEPGPNDDPFQGVDILVSCGPMDLAVRLAFCCPDLKRVICISTSSVYTKTDSPDDAERRLIAEILAAEEKLKSFCHERDIVLVLLRPTLIYGCGLDKNISRLASLIRRFRFVPLAGRASGLRQPVHADDLAEVLVAATSKPGIQSMDSPVAGGTTLSYREMVIKTFRALDLPPRTLSLPPPLLASLFKALSWLPGVGHQNAGFVIRQNRDMVFDDSLLRDDLGVRPRLFEPTAEDFGVPGYAQKLQPGGPD